LPESQLKIFITIETYKLGYELRFGFDYYQQTGININGGAHPAKMGFTSGYNTIA